VEAAQSAVDAATLNLGYTRISSPTDGLVGSTQVKQGSLAIPRAVSLFERHVVQSGRLLIKIWLEVGNEEQERRFCPHGRSGTSIRALAMRCSTQRISTSRRGTSSDPTTSVVPV